MKNLKNPIDCFYKQTSNFYSAGANERQEKEKSKFQKRPFGM